MDAADARYVSLTTFRKNGDEVPVPVWVVSLPDGRAGFTTGGSSGKVKRIRNRADVTVRPCDMRGNVADDAPTTSATATIADQGSADFELVIGALRKKYGVQYWFIDVGNKLKSLVGRTPDTVAILLTTP